MISLVSVVVGLGKTGVSCVRHLAERGIPIAVTDSRRDPPGLAEIGGLAGRLELKLGGFDLELLDRASQLVMSPGVPLAEPIVAQALARGIEVLGDIELFARSVRAPVIGITGTNGKSTVATLVASMAATAGRRVLAGGNLGRPALDLLNEPVADLYVLELSSFQLETTRSLEPLAAVVLNVTPDHMDRYASIEDYARAKRRLLEHASTVVLNLDDPHVAAMRASVAGRARIVTFSIERADADFTLERRTDVLAYRGEAILPLASLKISGTHNAANALAALALGTAAGLELDAMRKALERFPGLEHRSQWIADIDRVRYIDDSKGTNVGATLAAAAGLPAPLVLIAGGRGKGQDFAPLAAGLRGKVRHAVLIGEAAAAIEAALEGVCVTERAASLPEAVAAAAAAARAGDTVLLSPACASLDMFRDYAHRGEVFAAAVRALEAAR